MKARQSIKIKEIKSALIESGYVTLDQQAKALGLARSTTWTIIKGSYKNSGFSMRLGVMGAMFTMASGSISPHVAGPNDSGC